MISQLGHQRDDFITKTSEMISQLGQRDDFTTRTPGDDFTTGTLER